MYRTPQRPLTRVAAHGPNSPVICFRGMEVVFYSRQYDRFLRLKRTSNDRSRVMLFIWNICYLRVPPDVLFRTLYIPKVKYFVTIGRKALD